MCHTRTPGLIPTVTPENITLLHPAPENQQQQYSSCQAADSNLTQTKGREAPLSNPQTCYNSHRKTLSASKQPSDPAPSGTRKACHRRVRGSKRSQANRAGPSARRRLDCSHTEGVFQRLFDSSNSAENSAHSQGCCLRGSFTRVMNREISADSHDG